MTATFEQIREAALCLPKAEQARLLAAVALQVTDTFPGVEFQEGVCGGAARVVRTRVPVWTLEAARRAGMGDGAILTAWPGLTAEDLANAWAYARSHREEMDREIAANGDDS